MGGEGADFCLLRGGGDICHVYMIGWNYSCDVLFLASLALYSL